MAKVRRAAGRQGARRARQRQVAKLPRCPRTGESYWIESPNGAPTFTNYLFKFPAKFHPPVVRWALGKYGRRGSILMDPFTGSGTVQVEALARGISSVGIDIDPVACFIARVKTTPLDPKKLYQAIGTVARKVGECVGAHSAQEECAGADIDASRFEDESKDLWVPPIPNITHWFRRYVIIDLARLFGAIKACALSAPARAFLQACAGSIIRNVSNADPAPVSGLEVTSVQAKRNKRRQIRVFDTFFGRARKAVEGMGQLWRERASHSNDCRAWVVRGDALRLRQVLADHELPVGGYPLIITSPPYCRAVEYSRRHRLEMYWLGYIDTQAQHIALKHEYLGRNHVRERDWNDDSKFGMKELDSTIDAIAVRDRHKARTVRHYFVHMERFLAALHDVMGRRATAIVVLGDSVCGGVHIATARYAGVLAGGRFRVVNRFSYALRNHYMQYGLWNGPGIREEHVLVLKAR